jgi:alpha-glucosidase (family GH31 glycosyl hydrolase)
VKQNYDYVTKEQDNMGIAERIWINSQGIYFYVVPEVPLFIDSNFNGSNQLCFVTKFEQPYLNVSVLMLRYSVCSLPDAVQAQNHFVTVTRTKAYPRQVPDQRMVEHPIWSTWARYKKDINETVVEQFAYEILTHGYLNSQIEIDDDWETCYGELEFNTEKFPSPANLTRRLKALGFRVTLWVHPFVNFDCPSFEGWRRMGYYVKDEDGNVRTQWWNGFQAAIVDFTNPEAKDWYLNRLRALKASSEVDSFKYDAGETSWLPKPRVLNV